MVEYHGWAIIRTSYSNPEPEKDEKEEEKELAEVLKRIKDRIREIENPNSVFHLRAFNFGYWHLTIAADHNHRDSRIITFFKWIAEIAAGSYGLLYVHDDEDPKNDNKFMVWRMRKGHVDELEDQLLSPYFPTVEDPA